MNSIPRFWLGLVLFCVVFFQNCTKFHAITVEDVQSTAQEAEGCDEPASHLKKDAFQKLNIGGISVKNKFGYIDGPVHGRGLRDLSNQSRYAKIDQEVSPGLRIYNFWWASLEYSKSPGQGPSVYDASKTPHDCPAGWELYPPRDQGLGAFHYYHCVDRANMAVFKEVFQYDIGQSVIPIISLYGTPLQYRGQDCQISNDGFLNIRGITVHPWGCPPVDIKYFEDYVRILAKEFGFVSHWSMWNENNSDTWFHMSPEIGVSRSEYLALMMNTFQRIFKEEGRSGFRIFVSLDMHWLEAPNAFSQGGRDFLEGIWARVNAEVPWSLNLHPYTDEHATNPSGFPVDDRYANSSYYGFGTLDRVLSYQRLKLQQKGIQSSTAPQLYALLGEQGWYLSDSNKQNVAIEICKAQQIMNENSYIIGATYNTLFKEGIGEQAGLGLLPQSSFQSFSTVDSEPTYQAMKSTHPDVWGKSMNHYCCMRANLGCGSAVVEPPPPPPVEPSTYAWSLSEFGECSTKGVYSYSAWSNCIGGVQSRTAYCSRTLGRQTRSVDCRDASGRIVSESLCSQLTKPATSQLCVSESCSAPPETERSCGDMPMDKKCEVK